jgi:tRNA(adenine34) deaminase
MLTSDLDYLRRAVQLAKEAQSIGNLPIGAVITLDDRIIGAGKNSIWLPHNRPNRHAEIEALESVPNELWFRAANMTLYTTLEPCLMCM